jgi:predicted esterase
MNQTHWIPVAQEQRVDSLGTLSDATKHVWVGLHGYGQLVQFFARHFRSLATEERAFVFPQGPHKFYLNGVHGRVGASWMTKDERLVDIANQRLYLGFVFQWIKQQAPKATIHCVAFSQGVATIMRCIGHPDVQPSSILAWAGSWPPDLDETNRAALEELRFKACFGTRDEYITTEKQQEMRGYYLEKYNFEPSVSVYEGGHSFDAEKLGPGNRHFRKITNNQLCTKYIL